MISPAQPELLQLAAAVRGEEWADDLAGALAAAANSGWPWERAARYACRLIFTDDAHPRDLREAVRDPLAHSAKSGHGAPPPAVADALDEIRARAGEATARLRGTGGSDAA